MISLYLNFLLVSTAQSPVCLNCCCIVSRAIYFTSCSYRDHMLVLYVKFKLSTIAQNSIVFSVSNVGNHLQLSLGSDLAVHNQSAFKRLVLKLTCLIIYIQQHTITNKHIIHMKFLAVSTPATKSFILGRCRFKLIDICMLHSTIY